MTPVPETLKVKSFVYDGRGGDWTIDYDTCRRHIPELLKLAGIVDTETWHCPDKVNVNVREEILSLSIDQVLQKRTEITLLRHDYLVIVTEYKDMADKWFSDITCPSSSHAFTEIKNGYDDIYNCRIGPNIPIPPVEVLLYYLITYPQFRIRSKMTWAN
jgi:hypothetical protein